MIHAVLPAEYYQETERVATAAIGKLIDPSWDHPAGIVSKIAWGTPVEVVVDYAAEHAIDLIVIATHGRTGLSHVFLGSVAERIVREAPCPVLTIRDRVKG